MGMAWLNMFSNEKVIETNDQHHSRCADGHAENFPLAANGFLSHEIPAVLRSCGGFAGLVAKTQTSGARSSVATSSAEKLPARVGAAPDCEAACTL